ncbi:MAG TPA: hypothetical protein VI298_07610 [Geobacteraceae bacterium]
MTRIAVAVIMKETVGNIAENTMKIAMIAVIIANREVALRDGQPKGPD